MFRYSGKDKTVVGLSFGKLICLYGWIWIRFSPPTPSGRILPVARSIILIRFTCCEKRCGKQAPGALATHDDSFAEINL